LGTVLSCPPEHTSLTAWGWPTGVPAWGKAQPSWGGGGGQWGGVGLLFVGVGVRNVLGWIKTKKLAALGCWVWWVESMAFRGSDEHPQSSKLVSTSPRAPLRTFFFSAGIGHIPFFFSIPLGRRCPFVMFDSAKYVAVFQPPPRFCASPPSGWLPQGPLFTLTSETISGTVPRRPTRSLSGLANFFFHSPFQVLLKTSPPVFVPVFFWPSLI